MGAYTRRTQHGVCIANGYGPDVRFADSKSETARRRTRRKCRHAPRTVRPGEGKKKRSSASKTASAARKNQIVARVIRVTYPVRVWLMPRARSLTRRPVKVAAAAAAAVSGGRAGGRTGGGGGRVGRRRGCTASGLRFDPERLNLGRPTVTPPRGGRVSGAVCGRDQPERVRNEIVRRARAHAGRRRRPATRRHGRHVYCLAARRRAG